MKIMIIWFVIHYICATTAANKNRSIQSIGKTSLQRQDKHNNNNGIVESVVNIKTKVQGNPVRKANQVNGAVMKKKGNVSQTVFKRATTKKKPSNKKLTRNLKITTKAVRIRATRKADSKEKRYKKKITRSFKNQRRQVKSNNNHKIQSVIFKTDSLHIKNKKNTVDMKKKKISLNVSKTGRRNNLKENRLNEKILKNIKSLVTLNPTKKFVRSTLRRFSESTETRHSTIQMFKSAETTASFLNNVAYELDYVEQPVANRNIFIDIATLKPISPMTASKSKEFRAPSKKTSKSSENYKLKHNIDLRKKYDNNAYDVKRKILNRLHQLENDIKLVKNQIDNDSITIQKLKQQMHQKEKKRAELLLKKDNTTAAKFYSSGFNIQSPSDDNIDRENTGTVKETKTHKNNDQVNGLNEIEFKGNQIQLPVKYKNSIDTHPKVFEMNTTNDSDQPEARRIVQENDINIEELEKGLPRKMYEHTLNTSYNNLETTPSIFDLYDDLETYENFDGEFDWGKFFTSSMYYGLLKNRTANPYDGRRMLNKETDSFTETLTSPIIYPGEDSVYDKGMKEKVDFLNDYILERDISDPRDAILFANSPTNETIGDLKVPRPGDQWFIPKSGGLLSEEEKLFGSPNKKSP